MIPVCHGAEATWEWLKVNFQDHGRDIRQYPGSLFEHPEQILAIPVYALNDIAFHSPQTILEIVTLCGSAGV